MNTPISTEYSKLARPLRGPKTIDRAGKKYGRLTFLYPTKRESSQQRVFWVCKCECGTQVVARWGGTKSCGCLGVEIRAKRKGSDEWRRVCLERKAKHEVEQQELQEAINKRRRSSFDRLTHCTRKAATYRELCPHYTDCQDERVFDKKKASRRYTESAGKCFQMPTDDIDFGAYLKLFRAGGFNAERGNLRTDRRHCEHVARDDS